MPKSSLTQSRLKEVLDYCEKTGVFRWKTRPSDNARNLEIGGIAGSVNPNQTTSYVSIQIDNVMYKAHRLAWLYAYGCWPEGHIDHIDHNGANNAIENLRDVSRRENNTNARLRTDNNSGLPGVTWHKRDNLWYSYIADNGKRIGLGYHNDFFEACCRRKSAEIKYGYHDNHGRTIEASRRKGNVV